MTKYVKFISETVAAEAPTHKNMQPYTEEMAIADGYVPLVSGTPDSSLKNPIPNYRVEDGKVIEFFVEAPVEEETEELSDEARSLIIEREIKKQLR